jgi:hypothetical protein
MLRLRNPPTLRNRRIWQCPSASMTDAQANDTAVLSGGGAYGFFSYAMNIDL